MEAQSHFSILLIGLEGWPYKSAKAFIDLLHGRVTRWHESTTMHDAAEVILQHGCHFDAIFTVLRLPPAFDRHCNKPVETVSGPQAFALPDDMHVSEAIVLAALRQNPHAKCLMYVDGAIQPSAAAEEYYEGAFPRLRYIEGAHLDWEKHFFDSRLFVEHYRHLEVVNA